MVMGLGIIINNGNQTGQAASRGTRSAETSRFPLSRTWPRENLVIASTTTERGSGVAKQAQTQLPRIDLHFYVVLG
jgi:hypothetical protein